MRHLLGIVLMMILSLGLARPLSAQESSEQAAIGDSGANLSSTGAGGSTSTNTTNSSGGLRQELSTLVQNLVREIDPAAQVMVTTSRQTLRTETKLPGTPFTLKDLIISDSSAHNTFAVVDIVVFASRGKLPAKITDLIREMAGSYAKEVRITVKRLPAQFLAARKASQRDQVMQEAQPARIWEAIFSELVNLITPWKKRTDGSESNDMLSNAKRTALLLLASGSGFSMLALLVMGLWLQSQRRMLRTLEQGFQNLSTALEASGEGGMRPAPVFNGDVRLPTQALPAQAIPGDYNRFVAMPEDGVLALLSDCYWTEQDRYGAFVWRRISVERKMNLIKRFPELSDYGSYLGGIEEEDQGMEQDPSYLEPLPIWSLDMPSLTELVKQQPAILSKLSPLRATALEIKPTERLSLYKASRNMPSDTELRFPSTISKPRRLPRRLRLDIRSVADEQEILSIADPPKDLIEQVASLGWLLKIPKDRAEKILQPFSARDLATAWIGPKEMLDQLGKLVGEKKQLRIQQLMPRAMPSRASPTFLILHKAAVDELTKSSDRSKFEEASNAA